MGVWGMTEENRCVRGNTGCSPEAAEVVCTRLMYCIVLCMA